MLPAMLSLFLLCAIQDPVVLREVLAVPATGVRSRSPIYQDSIEADIVAGAFAAPVEGAAVVGGDGRERRWRSLRSDDAGWLSGRELRGGWAYGVLEVPTTGAWRLDVNGASMLYVNGAPHAGDVYQLGTTAVPLASSGGRVELLLRSGRGRMRIALEPAPAGVYLEARDRTMPDLLVGDGDAVWIGQIVSNATIEDAHGLVMRARIGDRALETELPTIFAGAFRKCGVRVPPSAATTPGSVEIELELLDSKGAVMHRDRLSIEVRAPSAVHRRTFVSAIDGSVQYFAVTPPNQDEAPATGKSAALLLSLHGASVEAIGQAAAYTNKPDMIVVAPTNRRPFGFDWEDWGRMDAIEVLNLAMERYRTDPLRTYLTGHSMGGHGTWQVGAHFADRFAAIAPSAGWSDFWSYAGGATFPADDPIGKLFERAHNASRTALLDRNYAGLGVYVLHGDADDNVPVREARAMRTRLAGFHPNFAYYEQKGAGHWWGNACVDWPPLIDFLRRNQRPAPSSRRELEFVTVNPAISSECGWIEILQQHRAMKPSRSTAKLDPDAHKLEMTSENVTGLAVDWSSALGTIEPATWSIRLDGVELSLELTAAKPRTSFARSDDGTWRIATAPNPAAKNPRRAGPFKEAFRNRMLFVVGTHGSAAENAWALDKARYDHETWRYRGNGAVDVVRDDDFDAEEDRDRNVVLFGNRRTNSAWDRVLQGTEIDLDQGRLRVGTREFLGEDLALLAVRPRRDSAMASVAIVGGTGLIGMRATTDMPYFVSGVAYPDWTVFRATFARDGLTAILGAGWFANDWTCPDGGDHVWR
ncbi:MAG: prolyl oligopeptidase family serine peptidase [Planctomycetota bacterium]